MSEEDLIDGVAVDEGEIANGADEIQFFSVAAALEAARDKLLDRSLRNKLINAPLTSSRARHVRIFDELSDEVWRILLTGRAMTFAPAPSKADAENEADEAAGLWVPPKDDEQDDQGFASRHRDNRLQTHLTPEGLQKRLLSLYYEGQTLEEEQGVNVLFLALGFLEWREAKQSDTPRFAPLVLLPVELVRDGARDRFKLTLRPDDLITNVSLQAWLKEQFGILLPDLPDADEWTPSSYFAAVQAEIGSRHGWRVLENEILLGFFSFAKFLLWRDLDPENWPAPDKLTANPLLKQILLRDDEELVDTPVLRDDERVDDVFHLTELVHITDADSSQAIAIQEAMAGKNLVIQGPPGTGKSQTITNIIAGAVQRGKSVLFVAEKMAALEVVHQRLVDRKLAAICLELHSRKSSKTQVLEQLKQARNAAAPPAWPSTAFNTLEETQTKLRQHADRLHTRPDGTLSAFDLMGRMSLLKARDVPAPSFDLPEAAAWSPTLLEQARLRAAQLGDRLAIAGPPASHPWRGAGMGVPDILEQERLRPIVKRAHEAADAVQAIVDECLGQLGSDTAPAIGNFAYWVAALRHLAKRPSGSEGVLLQPHLIDHLGELIEAAADGERLNAARASLKAVIREEAWKDDWGATRRILAGQGQSLLRIFSSRYREAVADLRGVWLGKFPKHHVRISTLDALIEGQDLARATAERGGAVGTLLGEHWNGEATDWPFVAAVATWVRRAAEFRPTLDLLTEDAMACAPVASDLADRLEAGLATLCAAFDELSGRISLDEAVALDGRARTDATASELASLASRWSDRFHDLVQWPPIRDDLNWLREIGAERLAEETYSGAVTASNVEPILMLAAYEAMWGDARRRLPEIDRSQGDELDALVQRFKRADLDRIRIAADEVARSHIDRKPTGSAGAVGVLVDEMKKSRRLKPVRKLMEEAGEAIQRFTPVFLMSPLSIAQYLRPGLLEFDMLVIDEASQVRPEDALGAIARCRQLVVVGDDKQLPPTNFFNRMVNDDGPDDEEDLVGEDGVRRAAVKDVESILNLCSRFPERMLRWHYRSEHPALIATSNRNFYKNNLMLPPSVIARANDGQTGLLFHKVAEGGYERGRTARNELEAEEVAQAALRHARECPDLSLGVGTFSVAQRDAVRDRLDGLARRHPELDTFMKGKAGKEAMFVKNLENIQGDERDVIFISVGYGRDRDGRLTQNFGPVGREGGERRLNVLITRARKRCEVFSSLVAEDIKLDGVGKPGVVALKEFLKLAKDGYSDFNAPTGRSFDSDFEEAVSYAVRELGYECHPQVGMAGFFIDLGVIDPRDPDRYVLGIECDGAAYHSSRYARDRDRLRQQILESRGWKIHRIWSTDWFYRREREIEKLRLAVERAIAGQPLPNAEQVYEQQFGDTPAEISEPETADQEEALYAPPEGLPPYQFAKVSAPGDTQPHLLSDGQLAKIVEQIVFVEQPIHEEEVGRRLAAICGLQRAGSRIQDAAGRGLRVARRQGRLISDGPFWRPADATAIIARDRSSLSNAEQVRKPAMISPLELAEAARIVLAENFALDMAELVVQTARAVGFSRTGSDVSAAIESAIRQHLMPNLEPDHMGRLRFVG